MMTGAGAGAGVSQGEGAGEGVGVDEGAGVSERADEGAAVSVSVTSVATAAEVLSAVGGAANVVRLTRCWSRLRFVLADPARADLEILGRLRAVAVVVFQGGELQVALSQGLVEVFEALRLQLTSSAGD
jgi:phosphotransferase system IIB component